MNGRVLPMVAQFLYYRDAENVLVKCKKLKGTNFSVSHDYPERVCDVQSKLGKYGEKIEEEGSKVSLSHTKLVNGKPFVWDEDTPSVQKRDISHTDATFIGYTKAFDKVCHRKLIQKLREIHTAEF